MEDLSLGMRHGQKGRVSEELAEAKLGHGHRTKRLRKVIKRLAHRPGASLPEAMVTSAELEGAYRFLNEGEVTPEALREPHTTRTLERCAERGLVFLTSDTTGFSFPGETQREGLGRINDGGQGFYAHFCLAVDVLGVALGVLGLLTYTLPLKKPGRKKSKSGKSPTRKSLRWGQLACAIGRLIKDRFEAIHLMDSEADDYELYATLMGDEQRFIIRTCQDRNVEDEAGAKLLEVMEGAKVHLKRTVVLSERREKETRSRSKRNQPRKTRTAKLEISSRVVEVLRTHVVTSTPPAKLTLNYVHVREIEPPKGAEAVDWLLVTTEPVTTRQQVEFIVDGYRRRWVIEEFFKAIKTGCQFQKSQLESLNALLRYLALLVPIAWQLLLMRSLQHDDPDSPVSFLTPHQLKALRVLSETKLPQTLTNKEALLAVAALGGHIKHSGAPGFIVIERGMQQVRDGAKIMVRLEASQISDQT